MFMKWIICILFDSDCSLIRIIYVHIIRASRPLECTDLYNSYFLKNRDFAWISTVACAWHRQVRLAALAAAKHTQQKSKQGNDRKTKPKARRRGAVPANPLGDRLPLLPPRTAFFLWFHVCSMHLLNLLFRSAMVA